MEYFEMNLSRGDNQPRRTTHNWKIIENNSMKLLKKDGIEYRILGFNSDFIFNQINCLLKGKEFKTPEKAIKVIDDNNFKFKNSIINIGKIKMLGESDYSSHILKFCKPVLNGYYWHYGNNYYDNGFRIGVEEPQRMWFIIKTVLNEPKYCLIYEKSNEKLNVGDTNS